MDDEIATLTSNNLLTGMVHELGLYAEYSEPLTFGYRMYGQEPLRIKADSLTIAQLDSEIKLNVSVSAGGVSVGVKVKADHFRKTFQYRTLPAVIDLKQGTFILESAGTGQEKSAYTLNITVRPLTAVADELLEEFLIEEISKTSNIVEFVVTDYEKQRSKDMFNTLIRRYNEHAAAYKKELGLNAMAFLDGRIHNLLNELSEVEKEIERYKSRNRLTMVETDVRYYADYLRELQIKTIDAEAQSHLIKLMDAFVKDTANRYKLVPLLSAGALESESSPLSLYNQALLERERLIENSGIDNPMVAPLTLQIDKLRESVYQMIENTYQSVQMMIREMKEKEKSIAGRMGEVPQQERIYVDYKRRQEILQGVYLILLQKREEIVLSVGQPKDKARLIDPAYTKPLPVAPRKLYAAIGIVLFTLAVTAGWIFCREQYLAFKAEFKRARK
jgi:uncharacterized protein involved in exopolysaccharide biosynthesis